MKQKNYRFKQKKKKKNQTRLLNSQEKLKKNQWNLDLK